MLPSLLPALSAPKGVRSDLSFAAASAVTAAVAESATAIATPSNVTRKMTWNRSMSVLRRSKRAVDRQRNEIAIVQRLLVGNVVSGIHEGSLRTEVMGVGQSKAPRTDVGAGQSNAQVADPWADKVCHHRRFALNPVENANRDRQVESWKHLPVGRLIDDLDIGGVAGGIRIDCVRILGDAGQSIPGNLREEARFSCDKRRWQRRQCRKLGVY